MRALPRPRNVSARGLAEVILAAAEPATLRAMFRRRPATPPELGSLVRRPDCPEEFLVRAVRDGGTWALRSRSAPVTLPVLMAAAEHLAEKVNARKATMDDRGNILVGLCRTTEAALTHGTVTAAAIVDHLTPVFVLPRLASVAPPAVSTAVADRLATSLGTDPHAWTALWNVLFRCDGQWSGTLPSLLVAAAAEAATGPVTWVQPKPFPGVDGEQRLPNWTRPRRLLFDLLACCPTALQTAVLPALDGRAVFDLLRRCPHDGEFAAAVVASGNPTWIRALAQNPRLAAGAVTLLLNTDAPAVVVSLYRNTVLDAAQRRRTVARLRAVGTDVAPFADELREYLLTCRVDLLPLVESGDSRLAHHLLANVSIPTPLLQLRLLLGVAQREGAQAVRALLNADLSKRPYRTEPWRPVTRKVVRAALNNQDDAAVVRALEAEVNARRTAEEFVTRLRRIGKIQLDYFRKEPLGVIDAEDYVVDWALLVAEHARAPFPKGILGYLRDLPGCPPEFSPIDPPVGAIRETGVDASAALAAAVTASSSNEDGRTAECRLRLGVDVDAWLLALSIAEDFPGSLQRLLDSVAAVLAPAATTPSDG